MKSFSPNEKIKKKSREYGTLKDELTSFTDVVKSLQQKISDREGKLIILKTKNENLILKNENLVNNQNFVTL